MLLELKVPNLVWNNNLTGLGNLIFATTSAIALRNSKIPIVQEQGHYVCVRLADNEYVENNSIVTCGNNQIANRERTGCETTDGGTCTSTEDCVAGLVCHTMNDNLREMPKSKQPWNVKRG